VGAKAGYPPDKKYLTFMNINTILQSIVTLSPGITMIAITGGPCGGKTTGLARIAEVLTDKGYKVLVVPEAATKLMTGGVQPWEVSSTEFQKQILLDILLQEQRFMEAAEIYHCLGRKVVILCDRGTMDGQAYVSEEEFTNMVKDLGLSLHGICNRRYHAVMHLRTAALGAEAFYTLENNATRKETIEEARAIDQRTLEAWLRHHHPRVIDNGTGFEEKIDRLVAEVLAVLGDPIPIERERRFLIEPISEEMIPEKVSSSDIIQDYLFSDESKACRIRKRQIGSGASYFYTEKGPLPPGTATHPGERLETERMISRQDYAEHLDFKDPSFEMVMKRRLCFFYENQFIEIDLVRAPEKHRRLALMEIEQTDLQKELILPPFIKVLREVTEEREWSNRELARR
jgi:CYTH domain-containing protein/thymidylate kinase